MKAMHLSHLTLAICGLAGIAAAQPATYIWSPPNAATLAGGTNNTIPFWGVSSTYQQVHDPENMGQLMTMKGMAFRNAGARTIKGRSWDMRLTLSQTQVTSQAATSTFANNLGTTNTTIVFGSATTWPTFSFTDVTTTGTVNPPSFTIPFSSPYLYVPQVGGLCWEWRHKNGTDTASMPIDATSGSSQRGTIGTSTGTGCIATGNTLPATATVTTPNVTGLGYQYQLDLTNAAASATAALAIGVTKNSQNIGWCSNLELNPLMVLMGQTDAQGTWSLQVPLLSLAGVPATDIHTQFGFSDAGLPKGIGLSDLASYKTPNVPGGHGVTRIYKYDRTSNGDELATTASGTGKAFGLVVGWLQ